MIGNRFEFLEFGDEHGRADTGETPPQDAEIGSGPQALRDENGAPMAQVQITDPRGYGAVLQAASSEQALRVPGMRAERTRNGLRLAEIIGERGEGAGQFQSPSGLGIDSGGILYIADAYNHRVQRVTPSGGVAIIGARGSGRGQFLSPQGVATDAKGAFYIVEQGNHRVQKYSAGGVLELVFGRAGRGAGELRGPTAIAIAPGTGDIFVADTGNSRVQRFNRDGKYLGSIGAPGGLYAPLVSPQAVAVDSGDNLFVADTFARRVLQYDPQGRPVQKWGTWNLQQPRALAVDPAGLLYVADSVPTDIMDTSEAGQVQCVEIATGTVRTALRNSERSRPLSRPSGLAVSPFQGQTDSAKLGYGDLYVSDTRNHRILRYVWN